MARLDAMFDVLLDRRGSDLHITVGKPPMIRVRGELVAIRASEVTKDETEAWLYEIVDVDQKKRLATELDLDFAHPYGDKGRFRASYFHKTTGLGAVFRVIPSKIQSLEELKTPAVLKTISELRSGLCLVTGPTGSGKSTTLAAMLRHINAERACHILTIEDPIEFVHAPIRALVTQREVGKHAPDFPSAIRAAAREDADVILVGELRSAETMALALRLASYGVLVFGTVHTNGAAQTIDRFVNAFPVEEQPMVRGLLAESLVAVVAQELLVTADGKKRVAAHEVVLGSSALASMIREGKTHQIANLMQAGRAQGMRTLDMTLAELAQAGTITVEVALSRAQDRDSLSQILTRKPL